MKIGRLLAIALALILAMGLSAARAAAGDQAKDDDKKKKEMTLTSSYMQVDKSYIDMSRLKQNTIDMSKLKEDDEEEIANLNGLGPAAEVIRLDDLIEFTNYQRFGLDPRRISSYSMRIYPDANPDSQVYYYLPDRFFIEWNPDDGYYLNIDHKPLRGDSDKNVEFVARLTPSVGLGYGDYNMLRKLLLFHLRADGKPTDKMQLRPMTASYVPVFDLSADDIGEEDISLTGVDPDTRELVVSIAADLLAKEVLVKKPSGLVGITGTMNIVPVQVPDEHDHLPPATTAESNLRFCDSEAYARTYWVRSEGEEHTTFVNNHPFEIKLKYLVYLYPSGRRIDVRGYDLGPVQLMPGDVARIPNAMIHSQIDSEQTIAAWYEYTFECNEDDLARVVESVTGGVGSLSAMNVNIDVIEADRFFTDYQIYKLIVAFRSPYLDPEGKEVITRNFELSATDSKAEAQLFLRGDAVMGAALYQYKITIVTTGGTVYQDEDWRPAVEGMIETIFIGADQIDDLMSQ